MTNYIEMVAVEGYKAFDGTKFKGPNAAFECAEYERKLGIRNDMADKIEHIPFPLNDCSGEVYELLVVPVKDESEFEVLKAFLSEERDTEWLDEPKTYPAPHMLVLDDGTNVWDIATPLSSLRQQAEEFAKRLANLEGGNRA